jgi:hypothetical protein
MVVAVGGILGLTVQLVAKPLHASILLNSLSSPNLKHAKLLLLMIPKVLVTGLCNA